MTEIDGMGLHARGNRMRPFVWGGAGVLLLLPALAMQFLPDSGVHWTRGDFVAMGVLLAVACALYELGAWLSGSIAYRAGVGMAVMSALLTVWVNLAVGMLGSEHDATNLLFAAVLLVAAGGAAAARFEPRGMALAMLAAALVQAAVVGFALLRGGFGSRELALSAMFALPWLAAAGLFLIASGQRRLRPGC